MKPSGTFILRQPINFEILACSFFFILSSSYIFWIRNKQKQRITWKQTHFFLEEQSSTYLKTYLLNICVYKHQFCYFYHNEIYLLHENFNSSSPLTIYKVCVMTYKEGNCTEFGPVDVFQFKKWLSKTYFLYPQMGWFRSARWWIQSVWIKTKFLLIFSHQNYVLWLNKTFFYFKLN